MAGLVTEKMINKAVNNLDADMISRMMDVVSWKWVHAEGTPSPDDIRRQARRLASEVDGINVSSCRSGGIAAAYVADDAEGDRLEVWFEAAHSCGYAD